MVPSQPGLVPVPEIGANIRLIADVYGSYAAFVITDGNRTYSTPAVKVASKTAGSVVQKFNLDQQGSLTTPIFLILILVGAVAPVQILG